MANAPIVVAEGEEELEVDYDSDGYPILPERSKVRYDSLYFDDVLTWSFRHVQVIDPLPPIDHSAVSLEPQLCFLESLLCSVIPLPSLLPPPLLPSPSHAPSLSFLPLPPPPSTSLFFPPSIPPPFMYAHTHRLTIPRLSVTSMNSTQKFPSSLQRK